MNFACERAEWWTRFGSDDWFEPQKLGLDAAAFERWPDAAGVYGLYTVVRGGQRHETCNLPEPAGLMKTKLLGGLGVPVFVGSWANCAVRTSVLKAIKAKYGQFCDPRLRNCEDFLLNARVVREGPFVWRGGVPGEVGVDRAPGSSS